MKITPSTLLNIVLLTILATSLFFMTVRSTTWPYDPWADTNEDGIVDVKDILYTALQYGATGDPAKPVTIEGYNWSIGSHTLNIPGGSSKNLNIITAGYKQITLGFKSPNYVDLTTGALLNNYYTFVEEFNIPKPLVYPTENTMWIEPSEVVLSANLHPVGYKFNVTVWINLNVLSGAWQFQLLYNKDYLNATGCEYTGTDGTRSNFFENSGTENLMPLEPYLNVYYNTTHNYALHGEPWSPMVPNNPFATGVGSLSWVEFEVMANPPEGQEIATILDISSGVHPPTSKTYVLDDNVQQPNEIPLTVNDCLYTIDWSLLEYDVVKTYTITGPVLTIKVYNPNLIDATLLIEYYMTT